MLINELKLLFKTEKMMLRTQCKHTMKVARLHFIILLHKCIYITHQHGNKNIIYMNDFIYEIVQIKHICSNIFLSVVTVSSVDINCYNILYASAFYLLMSLHFVRVRLYCLKNKSSCKENLVSYIQVIFLTFTNEYNKQA